MSDELWARVAELLEADAGYVWACDRENCDGQPHDGADEQHARTDQRLPRGQWAVWLIRAGRGWGKTRTGAEALVDLALRHPSTVDGTPTEWLAAGPTIQDSREVLALGPSGLVAALRRRNVEHTYNRALGVITLASGQRIHLRGGDDHDLARGLNLAGAWLDEAGTWRRALTAWAEGVVPALRQQIPGGQPRAILTTTPKPGAGAKLLADLGGRADGSVHVTRGATFDNAANLSAEALAELRRRYPEGTRLYRQELLGELVTDVEGALWQQATIDEYRVHPDEVPAHLGRVVVAIDPAASYGPDSDDTGIVIAGRAPGRDGHAYVLADYTCHLPPDGWATEAVRAYVRHQADAIVIETNQGGAMATGTVLTVAKAMRARGELALLPKIQQVRATRGKAVRAEPIAALYEQGQVHHVGPLPDLEEQLTGWTPELPDSPDRLDALVWALTALAQRSGGQSITTL